MLAPFYRWTVNDVLIDSERGLHMLALGEIAKIGYPVCSEHTNAVLLARLTKPGKGLANLSLQTCHFAGDPWQHVILAQLQQPFVLLQPG